MRRFGHVNSVTVWLVLLGFLCGMLVPGVSLARMNRQIETEGDPGDGFGFSGGNSGPVYSVTEGKSADATQPAYHPMEITFVVTLVDGKPVVRVEFVSRERSE